MSEKKIRVVIVDDEPLARARIEDLLAKEADVEIAGIAMNGNEAVDIIQRLEPDLVFLDVQMPGKSGLEVVDAIGVDTMPTTIFTTAFDRFAIKAFDVAAVDYLVKPFDDERFTQALRRAANTIELERMRRASSREYLERIPVELRGQTRFLPVSKVDYITASGPYAELHVADRTYAIRERMQTLEEQLDPAVFFRIHRSAIVRLDRVEALLHSAGGDYSVRLVDGTLLNVSRSKRDALAENLAIRLR
ncbi:MAG TPA: LytTR family DNA-binding domain-containing protein [Thermoanaerobaculia bacterium]|nr:LytTR family DNA-binding domain-containing protein [Thermoanaerobaculia bacterium]